MRSSPPPRLRPRVTTLEVNVVAPRRCGCVGCRSCERATRTSCSEPLTYSGRGQPPRYCEECRLGGAAKIKWELAVGEIELQRIWRVAQSQSRAERASYRISRIIQQFGGLDAAQSIVLSTGWSEEEWVDLGICVDSIIRQFLGKGDALGAAPFFGQLFDILRVQRENALAKGAVERAFDHLQVASRRKSAPAACSHWRDHFTILICRMSLADIATSPKEIYQNILDLEEVATHSDSGFVRSEARVEIAGQHVSLGTSEVAEKLRDILVLDDSYNDEERDWILAASRLRPFIDHGIKKKKPESVRREIETYGRIVLPKENHRQTTLFMEWKAALGEPVTLSIPQLRYKPYVPPIEPFVQVNCETG